MDKSSITGIALIIAILIGYSLLTKPSREEMAEQQRVADSIALVRYQEAALLKAAETAETPELESVPTQPVAVQGQKTEDYGVFASGLEGENAFFVLENEILKLRISKKGGKPYSVELKDYQTFDSLPLFLFQGEENQFGLEFFSDGKSIKTNELYFDIAEGAEKIMVTTSPKSMIMRLKVDDFGAYIEYKYTINPDSYLMDFNLKMVGMDAYRTDNVQLHWEVFSPPHERGRQSESSYTNLYYRFLDGDIEKFKLRSKQDVQEITESTKLQWLAYKQQFFSSVILSEEKPFEGGYMSSELQDENSKYIRHFNSQLNIPYDRSGNFAMPMKFYFGPNHFQTLKKIGFKLDELVTIGGSIIRVMNAFIIIPIFNWLNNFIGNYGLIIFLLTLIIKTALFPLTYKSYLSQAKMRALKPEIDEINSKIPKEKSVERQQATMALYRKVGVNPMGGCLPMILQMPILYAMFRFFPLSIELRQQSFLWATDLSTYDSILNLPFTIPMYGDHVSLFTLLMTVSTMLSMKLNSNPTGMDSQMPGMKGMMYIMPVMFMLILNNFSSGLTYYYFLANMITLGQNYLFKQFIDEEQLRKKLHAKKAKAKPKSNFQKRIEEAAKQRGYNLPKK